MYPYRVYSSALYVFKLYQDGIILHIFYCNLFFSLHIVFHPWVGFLAWSYKSFIFTSTWIPLYEYTKIYLSIVDGQLDYCQFSLFQTFLIWPFSPISWYTYVYIKYYVCSCVYMCIYVCVSVLVYICVCTCMCVVQVYTCMCVSVYAWGVWVHMYGYVYEECVLMCVHICTCVCTHENCQVRGYGHLKLF